MNLSRIVMTLPILALVVGVSSVTRGGEPVSILAPAKTESRARNDSYSTASVPFDKAIIAVQKTKPFQRTAPAASNKVKLLFLARTRPVSIDMTFTYQGKPLVERWTETMREVYKTFDRDSNGELNAYEAEHVFSRNEVRLMLTNGYSYRGQAGTLPKLADLDIDKDNRVSFDEFLHYYEHEFPGLIRSIPNQAYAVPDQITPEIFARLDDNGDGKISEAEFKQAEKLLAALDTDEDETVSAAEFLATPIAKVAVNPLVANPQGGAMVMRGGNVNNRQNNSDLQIFTSEIPGAMIQKIIAKYDKDGDFELNNKELGLSEKGYSRIDKNGDGKVSATELDAWRTGPADLEAEISLGDTADKNQSKVIAGKGSPEGIKISKAESALVAIVRIDGQVLDLGTLINPYPQNNYGQQFDYLFVNGKTFFTESELANPQYQYIRVIFDVADFNGDGRLTKEELSRYFALQSRIASVAVICVPSTRVPSLFNLMDTNKDGKLSVRELRNTYRNLIAHEPTGGTEITSAILQPAGSLRAAFGPNPPYDYSQYQAQQRAYQNGNQVPVKGPIWFRKMDRNGDGDISPSEFIGTKDDFKLIDTDGDGLISLEEATAYDEKIRGEKK